MTVDPVCTMKVEPHEAAAQTEHEGQMYYFCSVTCHKAFVSEPDRYAGGAFRAHRVPSLGAAPAVCELVSIDPAQEDGPSGSRRPEPGSP